MQIRSVYFMFLLLFLVGCTAHPPLEEMEAGELYQYLTQRYQAERYLEASEGFSFFTINYSAHAKVDSAQFLMGMAHFQMKSYLLAGDSFQELTRRFPSSQLVPEAMFMIGKSYWEMSPRYSLDQEFSIKTIDAMQAFIDYFPERQSQVLEAQTTIEACREKLAHKKYANGIIYLKMKDYAAAVIYFQTVQDQFYDTEWAAKSEFKIGQSYQRAKQYEQATEHYSLFLSKHPLHEWAEQAKSALQEIKLAVAKAREAEADDGE